MIKKIICLIMIFILSLAVVPSHAQTNIKKLNNDNYKLLSNLGFLPPFVEDELDFEEPCTRGDFAYMLHAAAGYEKVYGKTVANAFADVADTAYYALSVNNLSKAGIINGNGDGSFNPSGAISFNHAVKMVTIALGYGDYALYRGGYPTGYLACAGDADILDDVVASGDAPLTLADALSLIVNACDARVLDATGLGDNVSYDNTSGTTLISRFWHIGKYEGRVMGTSEVMFVDAGSLGDDEVLIEDKIYKTACSFENVAGCDVYFYYDEYAEKILSYVLANGEITITEIDGEDVVDFANGTLTYTVGDKESKIKVSQFADIAYNARPCTDIAKKDFTSVNGKIKLINNGDGVCDAVIISDVKVYVVGKADATEEVFYDKYTNAVFNAKNMEIIFKDQFGRDMSIKELGEYDVISAYVSKDGKYASLYCSNREAEGKINGIEKGDGKTRIIIGERAYDVAESFAPVLADVAIGTEGIFPLDIDGRVVAIKEDTAAFRWAWLIDCKIQPGLSSVATAKFFSQTGEMLTPDLADRVSIDGKSCKAEEAYNILAGYTGIIRYRLSDSKLKFVETQNDPKKIDKLYSGYDDNKKPSSNLRYLASAQTFGGKVAYDSKTIMFEVPGEGVNDETVFRLKSFSEFINENYYYVDAYRLGTDAHCADVFVYFNDKKTTQITALTDVTLVDYVSEVINEDGAPVYAIHGFRGGASTVDYTCDKSVLDNLKCIQPDHATEKHILKTGDVVKLGYNLANMTVAEVNICYEREYNHLLTNAGIANDWDGNRMIRAKVYSEDGGNLWITQEDLTENGVILGLESIESVFATKCRIYRIRTENGKTIAEKASVSDIMDYKNAGPQCSEIVMFQRNWNPGTIVILK